MAKFTKKITNLINQQVPEFVLGDHPKFLEFVKSQWPGFIEGAHHVKMAEAFDRIAKGKIKRLIIYKKTSALRRKGYFYHYYTLN